MDIENIVENAVARATLQFQKDFDAVYNKLQAEQYHLAAHSSEEAFKAAIPDLVKNALTLALKEIYKNDK